MSSPRSQRLRRGDRLRDRRDFQRVSREAERVNSQSFVLLAAVSRDAGPDARRLGITASRRVGGAVVRNRVKRRIREWFRQNRACIPPGLDLVVIARPSAAGLGSLVMQRELGDATARLRAGGSSR